MQKGFAPAYFLIGILVILAVVGGVYYLNKSSAKSVLPKSQVSVSPTAQPTTSATDSAETINWKIYTNKIMNYSISYPSGWKIEQIGADYGVNIAIVDANGIKIVYIISTKNEDNLTLDNSYKAIFCFESSCNPILSSDEKIINKSVVKIGNQNALTVNTQIQGETKKHYFFESNNIITVFEVLTSNDKTLQSVNQILSTFNFSDQNKAVCGSCPQFMPPAPNFCQGGKIVSGGKNECGCQLPPKCQR